MSRSKQKHKQERRRRHDRQISEGTRVVEKPKKKEVPVMRMAYRRRVWLSQIDPDLVRRVLDEVKHVTI